MYISADLLFILRIVKVTNVPSVNICVRKKCYLGGDDVNCGLPPNCSKYVVILLIFIIQHQTVINALDK